MIKTLNKHIAAFNYVDKTLLVSSAADSDFSIALFATVVCAPVGIASATLGLMFSFKNSIGKNI